MSYERLKLDQTQCLGHSCHMEVSMKYRKIVVFVSFIIAVLTIAASLTAAFTAHEVVQSDFDDRASNQENHRQEDTAFAQSQHSLFLGPALAVAWNQTVTEIANADDQFNSFKGHRAQAMMHIAMHDALNAVIPLYRRFAYRGKDFLAHPIAAAAQAAHEVVLSQYPGQEVRLGAELANWLSQIPEGPRKSRGIALGKQCAAAILALRT